MPATPTMPTSPRRYGWFPDDLDHRDIILPTVVKPIPLPLVSDLRFRMPPIYDQLSAGSCTGNGTAAAVDFERHLQSFPFLTPSRLFIYYGARVMEGSAGQDAGASIRDAIKVVASQGCCPESEWPYDVTKVTDKPSPNCYTDALKFKALKYQSIPQTITQIKTCLTILGRPIVFGISVFEAFESDSVASSGIVPMPSPTDVPIGGHCIVLCGHDEVRRLFLFRNSWGVGWGQFGYAWLPYDYVLNPGLASDFWVITQES